MAPAPAAKRNPEHPNPGQVHPTASSERFRCPHFKPFPLCFNPSVPRPSHFGKSAAALTATTPQNRGKVHPTASSERFRCPPFKPFPLCFNPSVPRPSHFGKSAAALTASTTQNPGQVHPTASSGRFRQPTFQAISSVLQPVGTAPIPFREKRRRPDRHHPPKPRPGSPHSK